MKNIVINDSILGMTPTCMALWINLLMMADENGVVKMGIRELAKRSGLSYQQTRSALATQVATHLVTQSATQSDTTITICNYDGYKGQANEGNAPANALANAVGNAPKEDSSSSLDRNEKESNKEKDKIKPNTNSQESKKETISNEIAKKETDVLLSLSATAEKIGCKRPSASQFDLSMIPRELLADFQEFIDMRKKIRAPIHTQRAVNARWKTLERLSGGDRQLAKDIIRQSLEHEWQDFYALRPDKEEEKFRQKKKDSVDDYSDDKYWD